MKQTPRKIRVKRIISLEIFIYSLSIFCFSSLCFAEIVSLEYFLQAPVAEYDRIRLSPTASKGALGSACPDLGELYMNASDGNKLYFCTDALGPIEWIAPTEEDSVWQQNGNILSLKDNTNPETIKVGIGTSTPAFQLTLENDGGILAKGVYGNGATPSSSDTIFTWAPKKAALRIGNTMNDYANWGHYSAAFISENTALGNYSTTLGGYSNKNGDLNFSNYSFLGGGYNNQILGHVASYQYMASIGGGSGYTMQKATFLGGGRSVVCEPAEPYAVCLGGWDNELTSTTGKASVMGGGQGHEIHYLAQYATIVGGGYNTLWAVNDNYSTILGGGNPGNDVRGKCSVIGGGLKHIMYAGWSGENPCDYSVIGGGSGPFTADHYAIDTADYATVLGGSENETKHDWSFIGGGGGNLSTASYATIAGGGNTARGQYSFIGGGTLNIANESTDTVLGGVSTTINGTYNFNGAGTLNKNAAGGDYSVMSGGQDNRVDSDYSWAGGKRMRVYFNNTFVWGYSDTYVDFNHPAYNFIIYSGNVGVGKLNPSKKLHIDGGNMLINPGILYISSAPPQTTGMDNVFWDSGNGRLQKDLAETFATSEPVEIGELLVIDKNNPGKLKKSCEPYDRKIAGIVSGAPAVLFEGHQLNLSPKPFEFTQGNNPPVALTGRVPCKVSLENGKIEIGDLLTSSSTPGHVMKATNPDRSFGAVIGKAMVPFDGQGGKEKTGVITVLLTIQ